MNTHKDPVIKHAVDTREIWMKYCVQITVSVCKDAL